MESIDIRWADLFISFSLLAIPVAIFAYYRTGLVRPTLIATARMVVQLWLVGLYLEYIFEWNNAWANLAWVLLMIIVAAFATTRRGQIKTRVFMLPLIVAMGTSLLVIDAFFLNLVLKLDYAFEARYFIPISGMLIGNAMRNNVIALNELYHRLQGDKGKFRYNLACGASLHEAQREYIRSALRKAFNPMIAGMAVIGLISLPGIMTGQILGGSPPALAIKYQILLMLSVFVLATLSVFLSIILSNYFVFDAYHNFKTGLVKKS
jgi:putative ABC transport system permease protein